MSGGVSSTDAPYQTRGSSGYISQEQIQRLPPTSVGDMFRNTPGVISAGNRNGQSLDLNIRGLQGMNRIATLVDGAQQTSSTYRGYNGHSNRTFVDSEFIGGIDVEKGPSGGPYGAGAMGGVVNMRTLNASDLVDSGKTFGARLRGSLGGNTITPPALNSLKDLEGNRLNPRVGVTVKPWEGVQLFATYTEGWRPPSVHETLLNMPGLLVPNPQLRPETSKNYEYGINFLRDGLFQSGDKFRVKLAVFDNNYEDYIMREYGIFVGLPTTQRVFGNIPSAHFDGIELSGSYDMGRVFIEGNYNYYTNVDFCNRRGNFRNVPCADFTSGADYFANYIPPKYAGALTVGTRWLDQKLIVGGRMTFAGPRAVGRKDVSSSTVNSDWNPYQVYDLFASYKFDDMVSFNVSVENVFDRYYLDAITTALVPAPGRMMRLGATVKF